MALIDLVSDLSKYRSTVKPTGETTPETSKAKDSRSFGAVLPITERISTLSPNIQKPIQEPIESKLDSTKFDNIVKKLQEELLINSVSKYSPVNTTGELPTINRPSIEDVTSKLSNTRRTQFRSQLNKSDTLIIKSESGTNNLSSPIDIKNIQTQSNKINQSPDINKITQVGDKSKSSPSINKMGETEDKTISSPDVNKPIQTSDRSASSPDIFIDKNNSSNDIVNPNTITNRMTQTDNKSSESPDVFSSISTPDKSETSPDLIKTTTIGDKSIQSPDVFSNNEIFDKTEQSPDIITSTPIQDKTEQSPIVFSRQINDDKEKQSPNIFSNITVLNKEDTSPEINVFPNDSSDNVTNPEIEIFGKPLSFDRTEQSVLINKDLISPINNILNPDVKLDLNVLTFDRAGQSPEIQTNTPASGFVKNPETKVFRIEQGTNHLIDESRLNPDGTPFRFVATTKIADKQSQLQKDNPKYDGSSIQLSDNSIYNPDTVIKQNPSGRNEEPEKSKFSIKGIQSVNFFSDVNSKGFTVKQQKGQSLYLQNSDYSWNGARSSAPTIGNFDSFVESVSSNLSKKSSEYKWDGTRQSAPSVDYFDISGKNTSSGFNPLAPLLESKYVNDSSNFVWKGNRVSAPESNFFSDTNGGGFNTFVVNLESKYVENSSNFAFKSTSPSPVNFITDSNSSGFTNKTMMLSSLYKKDTSRFTFKGNSRQSPSVNYFLNTQSNGFTNFVEPLSSEYKIDSSRFSFKGTRQNAPSVNYFIDTYNVGFKNLAESLRTNYDKNSSRFTWVGNREQAPEVDFFTIPGPNPRGILGFTKLFTDKTATKLTDNYSRLSFAGTTIRSDIKPVPFTKFFGFTAGELSGFMVGMNNRESSLYPILEPRLFADSPAATRFAIETERGKNKRQRTTSDLTKYINVSLGGMPWFDGTNYGVATLDNQLPFITTRVAESNGSSYFRKYERISKENTNGLGFLAKWATTRRSPSPLDNQYNKYSLPEDAFNTDPISQQPYVVRGIQKKGEVENQRWGYGVTLDEGVLRGGAVTQAERILQDVLRIGKWSISVKGLIWNTKQIGMQLMNPVVDTNPDKIESRLFGIPATQLYNPLSIPLNVATARVGMHLPRHGLVPFSSNFLNKYEDATIARENKNKFIDPDYRAFQTLQPPTPADKQTNYNRLIGLMKELLPNSFQQVRTPSNTGDQAKNAAARAAIGLARQLTGQSGIIRLSSNVGGAQSFLGIGGTQINRAKHPYLTHYTTTPLLMLTGQQKEPQYQESAKRDTYYAATSMYEDLFGDTLRTIAYNLEKGPYELNDENLPRDKSKIENIQPSTLDRIVKQNPFEPKYDLLKNRLRAVTATDVQRDGNISDGVNPKNTDVSNPIKQYRSVAYDKLGVSRDRRRSRNSITKAGDVNDFREDLLKDIFLNAFSTDPTISDYATQNLEDKFGFGKHGKPNMDRSNPVVSNINYGKNSKNLSVPVLKSEKEFRGDRINIIDYKRGNFDLSKDSVYETGKYLNKNLPGTSDLIEFYFTSLVLSGKEGSPAESIVFRAILGNIRDAHNGEWSPISYIGRADPLYTYTGYNREISFDFTVSITSRDEMKATWRKLNHLASWTAPEYTKTTGLMKAPIIRLNIGHLYRKMPGFMSNIEYSFDNTETTWETAQLKNDMELVGPDGRLNSPGVLQLPKTVMISCNFTPIGVYRPEYNGIMYSLYDDTSNGDLETGLIPSSNTKVNYFRTFELDNAGNDEINDSNDNKNYYRIEPGKEDEIPDYLPEESSTPT